MAAVRDILTHVEVEVASRMRICHRKRQEHEITKGQKCLVIHDHNGSRKNYCVACAMEILTKAQTKLLTLQREIQN